MLGAAMAWRQGQSYSEDLRARVLAAIDGGMAARPAASVFRVSVSYIYQALIRRRRTGEVSASSRRGHRPRKLTRAHEAAVAAHIATHPDITLAALQTWLAGEHAVRLSNGAMWSAVARLGCRLKKDTARRRAGPPGRRRPAPHLAGGAALRRCRQARLYRRDRCQHQDDPALRSRATRPAPVSPGPVRPLEDHHLRRRTAVRRPRRADGARRPDDWRGVPRLRRASADPDARTRRHRRDGQPAGPQDRCCPRRNRRRRRATLPAAALLARHEPDRDGFRQAQDAAPPSPGTNYRRAVATHRSPTRPLHSQRMHQLLPSRRL